MFSERFSVSGLILQIGIVFSVIGIALAATIPEFGRDSTVSAETVRDVGTLLLVFGLLLIIVGLSAPYLASDKHRWASRHVTHSDGREVSWKKVLCEDYAGRDVQIQTSGVFYRGCIERIDILDPSKERVGTHVRFLCKGCYKRMSQYSEWTLVKRPMAVDVSIQSQPRVMADGSVMCDFYFAGDKFFDRVIILPTDSDMEWQEQDTEEEESDSAST